ncbi:universal stress protein [Kribbella hippodromi]|uniref:Universal stress protein n=1 Tax=Kribbella hippodromi TaxID=434347 RepID=A0ABN2CU93_9ACTN
MSSQPAPIVIGYDGSPGSRAALDWAAAVAERTEAPLRILGAFEIMIDTQPTPGYVVPLEAARAAAEEALITAATELRAERPALRVESALVDGGAPQTLIEASRDARSVVLGSRGLGGWTGLVLGSVALQVTAHAECPVVVIPHGVTPTVHDELTVVVGVDGSKPAEKAIDFAFEQAAAVHAKVVALHAWTNPFLTYASGAAMLQFDQEEVLEDSRLLVSESVAGAAAEYPDVEWTIELAGGSAALALTERSATADLLVVGSRGRGGFTGLLLGSVSQSALHRTRCPIAVVR